MPNKNATKQDFADSNISIPKVNHERRKKAPHQDWLFRIMVIFNVGAWALLLGSLIVFHYARPEFISGVQSYWGIEGREVWSEQHLDKLLQLLQVCLVVTLVSIVLRSRRNRRKTDRFGFNLLILLVISVTSLVTIYIAV